MIIFKFNICDFKTNTNQPPGLPQVRRRIRKAAVKSHLLQVGHDPVKAAGLTISSPLRPIHLTSGSVACVLLQVVYAFVQAG